jgi:spoIIIJ-associated protein
VEWVETTGKTVEDAREAALDQLGVDEHDAEIEVVAEPRHGLFGRLRGEARVRARVRPTSPRPKVERRGRSRRSGGESRRPPSTESRGAAADQPADKASTTPAPRPASSDGKRRGRRKRPSGAAPTGERPQDKPSTEGSPMAEDVTVEEQAAIVRSFLEALVDAFDVDAEVSETRVDDETIELNVDGAEVGLLIGSKGQTLQSVQELARTVVQRQATGTHHGRVRIDVGAYRQRRRDALARFTRDIAADVVSSGVQKALEPMNAADRKVVHDTANEIEGVRTISEGEDPRRRVVILPASEPE